MRYEYEVARALTNGNRSYIYIYVWYARPRFSSPGAQLHKMGEFTPNGCCSQW